ncbi:uncharacterized protein LOC143433592 [Xylocopa sonorina]|uniref:uncharacterized protein LOC143433592 n=1 Tax=Xylocopa sonorina TaxID=1818115 RepID=UPI00403ADC50
MMRKGFNAGTLLLIVVLTTCLSIVVSSSSRERRHVGVEDSSHRPDSTHTPAVRSFKSSTSRDNEITTGAGRKVSHRLIGGHLRTDATEGKDDTLWDDGILLSSAGNGRETKNSRKDEDDEKKTLSQQVKEGKYGLIQNEIYSKQPKRPGIISYSGNPEVPKDTIDNLGGLDEDEIWLAENHVLVLRGGKFPGHEATQGSGDGSQTWPPIDNYNAPRRQVKIPPRPKVPPPFPVQLTEGGPIQIIGPNGTKEIGNGIDYKKDPLFAKGLLSEDGPLFAIITNGTIALPDVKNSKNVSSAEDDSDTDSKGSKEKTNGQPPGSLPPFYHAIPPGAVFVPPPSNQSDYDEEDQSIYYPPPYSFHYQQDNATAVPPGPLVPGIILPPPPDFFSALEDKKTTTKKYTKRPSGTTPLPRTRARPTYLPPRTLVTKQYKTTTAIPTTKVRPPTNLLGNTKMYRRTTSKNTTKLEETITTTTRPILRTVPYVEVTTPTADTTTTIDNPEFYSIAPLVEDQMSSREYHKDKNEAWSGVVTSKTIPIVAHYGTSTQSTLQKPIEVTPATIKSIITTSLPERSPSHTSYYFYEESKEELEHTTPNPSSLYYKTTTELPLYETVPQPRVEKRKPYYDVETVPPRETSKDYSIKFIGSPVKNSGPIRYSDSTVTQSSPRYDSGSARAQGQRMLSDHAPLYYQSISARPAVPVQPYYTTAKPQNYYRQETKPKPIYQYSFEAANYSQRGNQRQQYEQRQQTYNDYQNAKVSDNFNGQRYDYDNNESVPQKRVRPNVYKTQHPIYPSTTGYSVVSTTQNPQNAYYTQQDEKFLDDVTKEYFTIFGKKLPHKGVPNTTPIYSKSNAVTERPDYDGYVENYDTVEPPVYKTPKVKVHYGDQSQRPYSLKDDILVNYRQPLPPINPDSEFITVVNPNQQQPPNYRVPNRDNQPLAAIRAYPPQPLINPRNGPPTNYVPVVESPEELDETYPQLPISLEDDINVNYRNPRPTINPDAEFIDPVPAQGNQPEKPKAYFAYRLPGDGGHFYFLTPQAITQRPEQNAGHLYSKSRGTRLMRYRRRPGNV